MANISAIKLPDGVTYDIVDRVSVDKVFFAIPNTTTYTELGNAVDAGKIVLSYYNDHLYTLTYRDGNTFGFSCVEYTGSTPFKILGMRASQNAGTQTVWQYNLGYDIAKLASPEFTGTPKAPTATAGTNTTQIATTAFVQSGLGGKQDALVSGTNIKTVNGNSILGSGDLTVASGTQVQIVRW